MTVVLWAHLAWAVPFEHRTDSWLGVSNGWSNEVELADIDLDGDLDVLFANGGDYSTAGSPQFNTLYLNDGAGGLTPLTFGTPDLSRSAKVRDLDGDGLPDVFVAGAWASTSRLYLGDGLGGFTEVSSTHLPQTVHSASDCAIGDIDEDGDLDIVLGDSGPGNALSGNGDVTRLWINDGSGTFTDVTAAQMPAIRAGWSWDLDLVDVDDDLDLDLAISSKTAARSMLFLNDGAGLFTDASAGLPGATNNYEMEAMDLDGDGLPELATVNDGNGLRNRLLRNDGAATFSDQSAAWWTGGANPGTDDNVVVFFDYDDDGDADVLVGSLSGDDRLSLNDGAGVMTATGALMDGPRTPGTLSMAVGDLNGDGRHDLVMGQGELGSANQVYEGVDVAIDTLAPVVTTHRGLDDLLAQPLPFRARIHDRKTP